MKKSLLALSLVSLLSSAVSADCLSIYLENDLSPDEDAVEVAAALSTTAVGLAVIGGEAASSTIAAGSQLMDSDSAFARYVGLDLYLDGVTSLTDVAVNSASTSLAATGILDNAQRSYRTEIELIEDARIADTTLGTTLLDLTDSINDSRAQDQQVDAKLIATIIRDADQNEKFCQGDELMNAQQIKEFIENAL